MRGRPSDQLRVNEITSLKQARGIKKIRVGPIMDRVTQTAHGKPEQARQDKIDQGRNSLRFSISINAGRGNRQQTVQASQMAKNHSRLGRDKFVNVSSDRLLMLNGGKNRDGWPRRGGGGENAEHDRLSSSVARR